MTKQLTGSWLTSKAICELVKRRLKAARLPERLSPHSFREAAITDLLTQGVPLDKAAANGSSTQIQDDRALQPHGRRNQAR
jgi:site-specific recombinase XerD